MIKLFVVVGNTGAGKTRLINDVINKINKNYENDIIKKLPTYTTREIRPSENKNEIISIPIDCMKFLIENNFFMEYDIWDNENYYATPRLPYDNYIYIKPMTLKGFCKIRNDKICSINISVDNNIAIQRLIERGMAYEDAVKRYEEYKTNFERNYKKDFFDIEIPNNGDYAFTLYNMYNFIKDKMK